MHGGPPSSCPSCELLHQYYMFCTGTHGQIHEADAYNIIWTNHICVQRGDWRRICSPVFHDHGQDVKNPRGNGHEMNPTVVNVFLSAPTPPRFIYRNHWHEWFVPQHVLQTRSNVATRGLWLMTNTSTKESDGRRRASEIDLSRDKKCKLPA